MVAADEKPLSGDPVGRGRDDRTNAMIREVHIRRAQAADARGIARVNVAAWRDTYAGVLPASYLIGMSLQTEETRWHNRLSQPAGGTATFVAEDRHARIVGYGTCGANRSRLPPGIEGEFYEIYVDPAAQGGQLGHGLIAAMAAHLLARRMRSACVRVLRDNPTRWFYQHLGARLAAEETTRFAGAGLIQLAYVWPDRDSLERLARAPDDIV